MSVNIASLLEGVRKRPGIYLSPVSIFSLQTFLTGYEIGRSSRAPKVVPRDFTDWVAYRLHVSSTARGWARIIAEQQGDGEHAIECFFTLLDEYRVRVPQTVAILSKCFQKNTVHFGGKVYTNLYPTNLRLIGYNTQDPGLFLIADGPQVAWRDQYCLNFDWFKFRGPSRYDLEIIDREAFDRWSAFQEVKE